MYNEIIRVKLAEERKRAGYTQLQVAEKTGIDDSKIARIEVGSQKPDTETVGILAEFYGLSLDYVYGLGRNPKP